MREIELIALRTKNATDGRFAESHRFQMRCQSLIAAIRLVQGLALRMLLILSLLLLSKPLVAQESLSAQDAAASTESHQQAEEPSETSASEEANTEEVEGAADQDQVVLTPPDWFNSPPTPPAGTYHELVQVMEFTERACHARLVREVSAIVRQRLKDRLQTLGFDPDSVAQVPLSEREILRWVDRDHQLSRAVKVEEKNVFQTFAMVQMGSDFDDWGRRLASREVQRSRLTTWGLILAGATIILTAVWRWPSRKPDPKPNR